MVRTTLFSIWMLMGGLSCALADDLHYGFDGPQTSWNLSGSHQYSKQVIKVREHSFSQHLKVEGRGAETFVISNLSKRPEWVYFDLPLPPTLVISDLKLSFYFRCNQPLADCMLHVVMPHQRNPAEPDKLMDFYVAGGSYRKPTRWAQMKCATSDRVIRERLRFLRSKYKHPNLELRGMYVDRVRVKVELPPGESEVSFDQFRMGPIVKPEEQGEKLQLTSGVQPEAFSQTKPKFEKYGEMRLDRFQIMGQPAFLRILPHQGESARMLAQTGANIVRIQDFKNQALLNELEQEGLFASAAPPIAQSDQGQVLSVDQAVPLSFTQETERILFWDLGVRFVPAHHDSLLAWLKQVKHSDPHYSRPVAADVIGGERRISRDIDLLSCSRHILHSTLTPRRYKDFLIQRSKLAQPGSFLYTWIQTEPNSRALKTLGEKTYPIVVEPEQIRMQYYAAIQAGYRGVGFWKTTPLDSGLPGAYERRLEITRLNLETYLLEPWLATGRTSTRTIRFETEEEVKQKSLWSTFGGRGRQKTKQPQSQNGDLQVEGALVSSPKGKLMVAACYDNQTQFVPGTLSDKNISVLVPGVSETAVAWLVTSTGLEYLEGKREAGGVRVKLPEINQTAAILLTSDLGQKEELNKKISKVAALSAQVTVELAKVKQERVLKTVAELQQHGRTVKNKQGQPIKLNEGFFAYIEQNIKLAETAYQNGNYHTARQKAEKALRLLREVQSAYWKDTFSTNLQSPVSSPYTISFSTLPAHWEMMARLGQGEFDPQANLLTLGNFEAEETMELIRAGWQNYHPEVSRVHSGAQLYQTAKEGKYSLRLAAIPAVDQERPVFVERAPVRFASPEMSVQQGQLLYVSGWIRLVQPMTASDDGFMIYDSIGGQGNALRWFNSPTEWRRFSFIREVPHDQKFQVTFELTGLGEVHLDDLKVIPVNPETRQGYLQEVIEPKPTPQPGRFSKPLEFFNKLPRRLNLMPREGNNGK